MIIRLVATDPGNSEAARTSLGELTHTWGHDLTEVVDAPTAPDTDHTGDKTVDPVAIAALILSIPAAALAVSDLADRIKKRHRAKDLIDHAQQFLTQNITIQVLAQNRSLDLAALDPDTLLDLISVEAGTSDR